MTCLAHGRSGEVEAVSLMGGVRQADVMVSSVLVTIHEEGNWLSFAFFLFF